MADRVEVAVDAPVAERVAARERAGVVEELVAERARQRLLEARDELGRRRRPAVDPQYADAFINLGNLLKGDGILKGSEDVLQGVDRGRPE